MADTFPDLRRNRIAVVTKSNFRTVVAAVLCCMVMAACDRSATAAAPASIEDDAAALLARNCLECHNGADKKGGLDLTRRESALAGGDSGAALKPADPDASLVVHRIDAGEMPPKGRTALTAGERALLRVWIKSGAKWSADQIDPFRYTTERRAGYDWWSLQPLKNADPPMVKDAKWAANPIDQFILHRLEAAEL